MTRKQALEELIAKVEAGKLIEEKVRWFFLFVFPIFIRNQGRWNQLHWQWQQMVYERTGKWRRK